MRKEILYIDSCDLHKARRVCFTVIVIADKLDNSNAGHYSDKTFSAKKSTFDTTTGAISSTPVEYANQVEAHKSQDCAESYD